MTDLATADLDHYIGVAKQYAGWGVPVQMQPDYLLRVLEQARQVATIRDATLEEAAKYHDDRADHFTEMESHYEPDSPGCLQYRGFAFVNREHAKTIRAMKSKP